jgi:hypothetical protein
VTASTRRVRQTSGACRHVPVLPRNDLRHDAHRDFRRSLAADRQACGRVQPLQGVGGDVEVLLHALAAALGVAARADGADVEGRALHGFEQGHVVELGVVAEGYDAAAQVGAEGGHGVVGHFGGALHALDLQRVHIFLTRVADGDDETVEDRHGREVLGQGAGADQQHAVAGAKHVVQRVGVDVQRLGRFGRVQRDVAGGQVYAAAYQGAREQLRGQLLQRGGIGVEFQHQLERAAAGQAEAMGLIGGHAIGHDPRRLAPAACMVHLLAQARVALQQVVLDAAARHRTHGLAVFAQRHHGADGAGRRSPGAHDGGQHGMQALGTPAVELLEDGDVYVVHAGEGAGPSSFDRLWTNY